jgi:type I restriction enzyme S subunit
MPIRAFTIPIPAFTMRRSSRSRCADLRVHDRAEPAQKALHRLRSKDGTVTTDYMQHFMMLRFRFMTDLVAEANTTSTIPHLPREKLLAIPVWYPPREEQDAVVEVIGAQARREQVEALYLAGLRGMKAALMSVLLTGEVRVKPAEVA